MEAGEVLEANTDWGGGRSWGAYDDERRSSGSTDRGRRPASGKIATDWQAIA